MHAELCAVLALKLMKTIYSKFDKALIGTLPRVLFQGRIVVVLSAEEAKRAVDFLLTQTILGVDTETRPSFRRGNFHNVALLQVSTRNVCFLFFAGSVHPVFIYLLDYQKIHFKENEPHHYEGGA